MPALPALREPSMLLEELILTDIGPFSDTQTLRFSTSEKKPVTLIGGQNGMGKTTIINALALVLYGSQSKRLIQFENYNQFLRGIIHHGKEHAAVTLKFSRQEKGQTRKYEITRSWSSSGNELFKCFINGERDQSLTESSNWLKTINRFIPLSVAGLAIFDGEKIEALANPERSNEILKTTIEGLLGLDLLTRLLQDLKKYERTTVTSSLSESEREGIEKAQIELDKASDELLITTEQLDTVLISIQETTSEVDEANEKFEELGGSLFRNRNLIKEELLRAEGTKTSSLKALEDLASDVAPLLLLPNLLHEIIKIGENSAALDEAALLHTRFKERDEQLLTDAASFFKTDQLSRLEDLLVASRELTNFHTEIPFHVRPDIQIVANGLVAETSDQITADAERHLQLIESSMNTIETAEKKLHATPDESEINQALFKVHEAEIKLKNLQEKLIELERNLSSAEWKHSRAQAAVEKLLLLKIEEAEVGERAKRIHRETKAAHTKILQFRNHKASANAERIAGYIEKAMRTLFRKNELITSISLDPEDFKMRLKGQNGEELNPKKLSAGERQLLATAILWGLSQATGKKLPTIIDTPLGRLDSSHRTNLVEQYFPNASRQIVLLSTDEEIIGDRLEKLNTHVGSCYFLDGSKGTNVTTLTNGYLS